MLPLLIKDITIVLDVCFQIVNTEGILLPSVLTAVLGVRPKRFLGTCFNAEGYVFSLMIFFRLRFKLILIFPVHLRSAEQVHVHLGLMLCFVDAFKQVRGSLLCCLGGSRQGIRCCSGSDGRCRALPPSLTCQPGSSSVL